MGLESKTYLIVSTLMKAMTHNPEDLVVYKPLINHTHTGVLILTCMHTHWIIILTCDYIDDYTEILAIRQSLSDLDISAHWPGWSHWNQKYPF